MTAPLERGDALRDANDQAEHYRALNAKAKRAQAARDAQERAHNERLQAALKADTKARHPEWFA